MVKTSAEFVCVRGTQKFANHFKIKAVPMVLFTDADGDEIHRAGFGDAAGLDRAMTDALAKFQDKAVAWKPEAAGGAKLLVLGFDDEAGAGLKALEDRSLVKLHASCEFVKPASGAPWGVTTAPAILLCDPSTPDKPLERLVGKKSPAVLKAAIQRALHKLQKG